MSKSKVLLLLLSLGLLGLILWRLYRPAVAANLLANPDFEQDGLSGWQVAQSGETQTASKLSGEAGNSLLVLEVPDTAQGSWVGVGQRLPVAPLQRYRLRVDYRLAHDEQSSAKVVLRVSQFDQNGTLLKTTEISNPEPLFTKFLDGQLSWDSQQQIFVSDERAAAVEIGIGLVGSQATRLEIDNTVLEPYPTDFTKLRRDFVALVAVLALLGLVGYAVGRALWPVRRRVAVNTGLAVTSLALTLVAAEVLVRFVPISLISPDWPAGYHIPFADGKSFRLAYNYPATFITDNNGDRHLAMTNSLGVRDVEIPYHNQPAVMVILGNSMTIGWAISDLNDTWPRRLNAEIEQLMPGSNYHLVNAGLGGYNTFQEVYLFETLIEDMARQGVKPEFALLSFYSDIWERNLYGPAGRFNMLNGVIMYGSVKQALLELAGRLVERSPFDDLKLIGATRLNSPHRFLLAHSRLYFVLSLLLVNQLDENWDALPPNIDPAAINYQALQSFKDVAEANDIKPIVAYLPADDLFSPWKFKDNEALVAQLSQICQSLGLSFVNPYQNMENLGITEENARETLTLVYNRHYSAAGNALYARALAPLLADFLTRQTTYEEGNSGAVP